VLKCFQNYLYSPNVVTLERREEDVLDVKEQTILAIDCSDLPSSLDSSYLCTEVRDNSTTVARWLSVRNKDGTMRCDTVW